MAPVQNTFSIIPNPPSAIDGCRDDALESQPSHRPMTTKQVKKAYRKANTGPKLSKAEKRRIELFEQDRIRKEFEKEKNQARARAARDRKKEKEQQERAEKKKKGLPLVDVHPSQDTIARFVRGNAKRQGSRETSLPAAATVDDTSSGASATEDEEESQPPHKKKKVELPAREENKDEDEDSRSTPPATRGYLNPRAVSPKIIAAPTERRPTPKKPDPKGGDLALLEKCIHEELFGELLDTVETTLESKESVQDSKTTLSKDEYVNRSSLPVLRGSPDLSSVVAEISTEEEKPRSGTLPSSQRPPPNTFATNQTDPGGSKGSEAPTLNHAVSTASAQDIIEDPIAKAPRMTQPLVSTAPPFKSPKTPMGPPPVPKFKSRTRGTVGESRPPHFLLKQTQAPVSPCIADPNPRTGQAPHHHCHAPTRTTQEEENPPTSTQLFVFNHLDDFFPTPSQEARELFGEPKPSNPEATGGPPGFRTPRPARSPLRKNTSPSSVLAKSGSNRRITALKKAERKCGLVQRANPPNRPSNRDLPSIVNNPTPENSVPFDMPFFSTQDFVLSSQDVRDLEDETRSSSSSLMKEEKPGHRLTGASKKRDPSLHKAVKSVLNAKLTPPSSSLNASKNRDPSLPKAVKSVLRVKLTPSPSSLNPPRINKSQLNPTARLVGKHGRTDPPSRVPDEPVRPAKPLTLPPMNKVSLSATIRKNDSTCNRPGMSAESIEAPKSTTLDSMPRRKRDSRKVQAKNCAAPLQVPPEPSLVSSGRKVQYRDTSAETNPTTAREGVCVRQSAQGVPERFDTSDDGLDRLLLESVADCDDIPTAKSSASTPRSTGRGGSAPRPQSHSQAKGHPRPRPLNQLPGSVTKAAPNHTTNDPSNKEAGRRGRLRSSYEQLMQLLENKENKENNKATGPNKGNKEWEQGRKREQRVPASQETDYGDAGLDDILWEIF
ncbi:hypothetical protein GGS23DRAFT_580247 [Durotheca rogersii]|uniref:uncharacterized protein n=1 Tax=Durotheca rogersii TaxID=419775 RepID=UPI002220E1F5|nr:uncharacterized protein GGS23DRAFT_580247 [Durotheca rogersii]KAI5860478.1 hypothetical protein GGS23DRAFT_580247 [Durotheca rogersii]